MNLYRRRMSVIFSTIVVLALTGCGGGDSSSTPSTTSQLKGSYTASEIGFFTASLNINATPAYDVDYHKVSYRTTTPAGATTTASGLLLVPKKATSALSPLLSLQHGTIESQIWAPSALGDSNTIYYDPLAGLIAASLGYVVAMPDYLGYGDSAAVFHPYVQANSLATTTIDMIRASQEVLSKLGVGTNTQLFLAGYSEGGYATLATQKEIETNLSSEFTIAASEPGSGPYDMWGTTDSVMTSADLAGTTDPAYLAFVIEAYRRVYVPSSSASDYYTPTAVSCVNANFSNGWYGSDASDTFDNCVGTTLTNGILNSTFITAFNSSNASVDTIRQALVDNDIYDWKPQVPTRLYYSPYDEAVPPANTTVAYAQMVANGATTVETATCGLTSATSFHGECIFPYFENLLAYFSGYANDL